MDYLNKRFYYPVTLINDATRNYGYAREPVIRRMPDGSLFCTFLTGGPTQPHNNNIVAASRSFDDGETWTDIFELFRHSARGLWCTEIFTESELPCMFIHTYNAETRYNEIKAFRSYTADSGNTWSEPGSLPGGLSNVSVRQGIVLSNGDWLFPVYWQVVEKGWDSLDESKGWEGREWPYSCGVLISCDKGECFQMCGDHRVQKNISASTMFWENNCIEVEPGHVIMLARASKAGYIYRSDSYDFGRTWTSMTATEIPNPDTKFSIAKIGNNIILAHNPHFKPEGGYVNRLDLSLWVSGDGMKTWKTKLPLVVPDIPMFYPHMFCDDTKQMLYLVCENKYQSYFMKIPYFDFLNITNEVM